MKECLSCHKQIEDLRHTCPHCGGTMFIQSGSGQDMTMLDAMQKQAEAKEYVDRGAQFLMQGRYGEAESELRKAIEINPMNATAHGNMGGVFLRQGRTEEAIPWLEKALELNPRLEGVPEALAQAKAAVPKNVAWQQSVQSNLPQPVIAPSVEQHVAKQTNGLATASLILGIASIPLSLCYGVGIPLGIAAFIMGIIARKQIKERAQAGSNTALIGIITGGITAVVVLTIVILALLGPAIANVFSGITSSLPTP